MPLKNRSAYMLHTLFLLFFASGCGGLITAMLPSGPAVPETCIRVGFYRDIDGLADPPYPERSRTGAGFRLGGVVRDATTCAPVPGATVMFDMTNPQGEYDGTQQGTVITDAAGTFQIESTRPGAYGGGMPHIHLFAGAPGYGPVTTSHDLVDDAASGWVEIILRPAE